MQTPGRGSRTKQPRKGRQPAMTPSAAWQVDDRNRRHVRHTRLCMNRGAPRNRLVAALEEALRLAALPGENEGRTYFFRYLHLAGLPADGDRRAWLQQFQRALTENAADAVHGADTRAGQASAIFFRSRQEALEILLHRLLTRRTVREWFWPMVLRENAQGTARETDSNSAVTLSGTRALPVIVEALHSTLAGWVSVAAALFAAPRIDVVYLLRAIPEATAQAWLNEMDGWRPVSPHSEPRISPPAQRAVHEALRVFGFENPRTVWLTTLAILHESPMEIAAGTALPRARMALQFLVEQGYRQRRATVQKPQSLPNPLTATEASLSTPSTPSVSTPSPAGAPSSVTSIATSIALGPDGSSAQPVPDHSRPMSLSHATHDSEPAIDNAPLSWFVNGLPTLAAGLFFLLNALERIGMPQAVASGLIEACPDFLPRLFERVAMHAGIPADDPIAAWLVSLIGPLNHSSATCESRWWPSNVAFSRAAAPIDHLLRVWVVALRRWCWRAGKISVREVVVRPGVFSVYRTDLDVSLPLDDAEIRIRRIGLDLDPGWLPWFGCVVRFHYLYHGDFHA